MLLDVDAIANDKSDQLIGDEIQDMGGSGGPLHIWVSIGVAMLALIVCFIAYRRHYKTENKLTQRRHNKTENKLTQEDDDKALDQPLIAFGER